MQPDLQIPIAAEVPADEVLEANGAVIGIITIRVDNVFNPDDRGEDNAVYRLTNALHFKTHQSVVERQLSFKSGDPFSARLLPESERILRGNEYVSDARIRAVRYENNTVDIVVAVHDVCAHVDSERQPERRYPEQTDRVA
ncbi:MAG: hypothetical protein FD165_644 [Gammaproteobacteria bacterium]|nr:MAG: hypothetical protein FD165_644 [Gammaproteobacteria bacterium]TND02092.1 MAG: hypothetical protein FD120_2256 [Gammaproteobacteria bacterium]